LYYVISFVITHAAARFIYNVEGISGLYRGFPAKLVEELIKGYVKDAVFPGYAKPCTSPLPSLPWN
jgi:hypothetical protein